MAFSRHETNVPLSKSILCRNNPIVYRIETVVCNECLISKAISFCIKNVSNGLCKDGFFSKMPNKETNWEFSLYVIEAIGRNYKISTELRSESLAEILMKNCANSSRPAIPILFMYLL